MFDERISNKEEVVQLLKEFIFKRGREIQNVTVNVYEDHWWVTYGQYQSGALQCHSAKEFLEAEGQWVGC